MKRIAIVEDNPDNLLLMEVLLEKRYRTKFYEDGFSAVAGITEEPPDLVLLDISLPGMDGTEVLQKLRQCKELRDLPVVALTAHAMVGDRAGYLDVGFDGYVSKPLVDENVLFGTIEHLLRVPEERSHAGSGSSC